MWFMRSKLIDFFKNCQAAERIGYKLPSRTYVKFGQWHNFVSYVYLDENYKTISFHITREDFIGLGFYKVKIFVKDILVYEDHWRHSAPKKMKEQVYRAVEKIEEFNKQCLNNRIHNTLYAKEKSRKKAEKARKIQEYEREKRDLIDMFEQ